MGGTALIKKLVWYFISYSNRLHPPSILELLTMFLSVYLIREELASIFGEVCLDLLADHLIVSLLRKVCPDSVDVGLVVFISIDPSTGEYADDFGL